VAAAALACRAPQYSPPAGIVPEHPQMAATTQPLGVVTRRASASGCTGSAAYWNELKPVTTSKARSSNGNSSISPTRISAPGQRLLAISSSEAAASSALTLAPRARAMWQASPAPHPTPRQGASFLSRPWLHRMPLRTGCGMRFPAIRSSRGRARPELPLNLCCAHDS
jgi:hypothetical protein